MDAGTSSNETTNGENTTSGPPLSLSWEAASTSVDIEDDSEAFLCEVSFSFALHEGVLFKDVKESSCTSKSCGLYPISWRAKLILSLLLKVEHLQKIPSTLLGDTSSRLHPH